MSQTYRLCLDLLDRTFRSKPLVFLLAAWVCGILLADHSRLAPGPAGVLGLGLVLGALTVRWRWAAVLLLLLSLVSLGLGRTRLALTPPRGDISEWTGRQVAIVGTVDSEPAPACDRWRCLLRCRSVTFGDQVVPVRGRLRLSTPQDLTPVGPGDSLCVYGVPERPSPPRNPGGFSSELWLARQGVFGVLQARPQAVVRLENSTRDWRRVAACIRQRITDANRRAIPDPEAAALVNSFLFGDLDQGDQRPWGAVEERFRRAGLSHVLVVSGAQVALLFGLLALWRRWVLGPRQGSVFGLRLVPRAAGAFSYRRALAIGLAMVVPFALLAGLGPSVLRAALVVGIFFLARCLDREVDPVNSLAAAALLLLAANPLTLYDVGFLLSFAAVWGLLRWTEVFALALMPRRPQAQALRGEPVPGEPRGRRPGLVALTIAATPAAVLATAPIIAYHFHQFSIVSPAANPPVCLMAAVLLPLGLFTSLVNAVVLPAGAVPSLAVLAINWPTTLLAYLINGTVRVFARPDWATVPVFPPSPAELVVYYALLTVGSLPGCRKRRSIPLACVGMAVLVLANAMTRPARSVSAPTLTFIDVGQGDACLVRLPGGATILVDGGGSPRAPCATRDCSEVPAGRLADSLRRDCLDVGRDILAEYLRHERVRRIDLLVLTHPHDDHLWGLDTILDPRQRFQVRAILDARQPIDTPAHREWQELLSQRNLKPVRARRGMQLTVGPAILEVLHPPAHLLRGTGSDENNNSIVLRLDVAGSRVLLAGDAEAAAEASMAGQEIRAEVLKVGHHGSASSSDDAWLDRVRPSVAVISCGRHNPFGHPSPATLSRLRRRGASIWRTDQDGAVTAELRPTGVYVTSMFRSP